FTGRITALNGRKVTRASLPPSQRWAFDRDMPMAALAGDPHEDAPSQGLWWDAAYAGPPEVALDQDIAKAANLKLGDTVTIAVLGREIDARVAVIHKVGVT